MEPKNGIYTTEFWLTAVANVGGALIALLAAYGLLREDEGRLWLNLVQALAVAVIPLALAQINRAYIASRTAVKRGAEGQGRGR